jgi:hypothetical protein
MVMIRQKFYQWHYPIVILFSLYLSSCQPQPDSIDRQINTQIQQGRKEIKIAEITNFPWTKMYVFAPYTPAALVDKFLGFEWPEYKSLGIESTDTDNLLVFVNRDLGTDRVVKFTKCSRSFGDFRFRQEANGYAYTPDRAVFAVSVKGEDKLLLPVQKSK